MRIIISILLAVVFFTSHLSYSAHWLYSVRPGDTFWDICEQYTTKSNCWQQLPDLNEVSRTRQLPPGFVVRVPIAWLKIQPTPAQVSYVIGEVFTRLNDNDKTAVSLGDKLLIGSVIETGNGYAKLNFGDGSSIFLEPNSQLSIDAFSTVNGDVIVDSEVRLNKGSVRAKIKKRNPATRFKIYTPAAVAAVRGTEYRVTALSADGPKMRSEVFEGLIEVKNDLSTKNVPFGFGIHVEKNGQIPPPTKLLPAVKFSQTSGVIKFPTRLTWQQDAKAKNYTVSLLSDNTNNEVINVSNTKNNYFDLLARDGGCYRIRVNAIDENGFVGLPSTRRICEVDKIPAPSINPKNTALDDTYIMASWSSSPEAYTYRVQVSSDKEFNNIVFDGTIFEQSIEYRTTSPVYVRVSALGFLQERSDFSTQVKLSPTKKRFKLGY